MSLLEVYCAVGFASLVLGGMLLVRTDDALCVRVGARFLLAAPVWPLPLAALTVWLLYKLVRVLIRMFRWLFLVAFNKHPNWKRYEDAPSKSNR